MTNCIKCHKELCLKVNLIEPKMNEFVCVCFDCIKKQNKN